MSSLLVLAPLLAQIGPASALPSSASPYASQLPIEIIEKKDAEARHRDATQNQAMPAAKSKAGCMSAVETDPQRSADLAHEALGNAIGREKVRAGLCLGVALADLGQWSEASKAFTDARDAAEADDHASKARLGAMAGSATLAGGEPGQALLLLGPAANEAKAANANDLVASIALDRARALVAVKQPAEAAQALAEARTAEPENAQAWLLSATLSRRENKLVEAQAQIEKAAALAPTDPEVGLEAGVIAMLAGNEAAARKSWSSVEAAAPDSEAAATAKGYLAQLGGAAK